MWVTRPESGGRVPVSTCSSVSSCRRRCAPRRRSHRRPSTPRLTRVEQGAGAVADARALDIDQIRHQPPMIGGRTCQLDGPARRVGGLALCVRRGGSRGWRAMVDLSAITRPVGRLVATAQNGLEVLRYGGLETGAVPSPVPAHPERVRCTGCGATSRPTPGRAQNSRGPPVLMVHPMMMSADMWDVTRDDGAVGILHKAGIDPWVIDFGSPDKVEGGDGPQPRRPRRRAERGHRHRQRGHRPRRAPDRLLAGRHVRLPDRGLPAVEGPGQHRRVRLTRSTPWPPCR